MSDLVKRLRAVDQMSVEDCFLQSNLLTKAADRIEALEAESEGAHMVIATERAEVLALRKENARLKQDLDRWTVLARLLADDDANGVAAWLCKHPDLANTLKGESDE